MKIVVRMLEVKYSRLYQRHLRERRRATRRALAAACAVFVLVAAVIILVVGFGLWAVFAERRATEERIRAEETVDFMTFGLESAPNFGDASQMETPLTRH